MTTRFFLFAALLPLISEAGAPLLRLNEDGTSNIQFLGDASVSYNDNIFYRKDKTSDTIFNVSPGLELNVGGDGNSKFKVTARESFSFYTDNNDLNSQLGSLDALYTYDAQSRFKGRVGAGISQRAQPSNLTAVAGGIIKTLETNALAIGEYKVTEKSSIETGVTYNGIRYTNDDAGRFNDQDSISIPVSWYYSITEKFSAGLTYKYTFTDLLKSTLNPEPGSQEIHFIGLTARGKATEKLSLEANAGVGMLSISDRRLGGVSANDDYATFNFGLKANYAVTEKLTTFVSGNRLFSAGAQAQAVTTTGINVGANYTINEDWAATAYTGIMRQEFDTGGRDNIFTAGTSLSYAINKYWKTSLSYSYLTDSTNRPGASGFDNNIVTLSASVRY